MTQRTHMIIAVAGFAIGLAVSPALGQSLFEQQPEASPDQAMVDPAAPLYAVSLYAIQPPEPRTFQVNDLVTIVVSETFDAQRDQKVETEQDYSLDAMRLQFPEFFKFLALNGDPRTSRTSLASATNSTASSTAKPSTSAKIASQGASPPACLTSSRMERSCSRPARSCRPTTRSRPSCSRATAARMTSPSGTPCSLNQMFDLNYEVRHEGEMRRTTRKGLIPRALETLFNF